MMTMTSKIDGFAHDSEAIVKPDDFLLKLISARGMERRSRVAVYGLKLVLPILGAIKP